jgi:hypothetical protein
VYIFKFNIKYRTHGNLQINNKSNSNYYILTLAVIKDV